MLYGFLDPRPATLSMNWPLTVRTYNNGELAATEAFRSRVSAFIGSGLGNGTPAPVVAETSDGLERMADAHRLMESDAHTGRIVVTVRS